MSANPCQDGETFLGTEGPNSTPVCIPAAVIPEQPPLPSFVPAEPAATPTPVDAATCAPFPACRYADPAPAPGSAVEATVTATAVPVVPATAPSTEADAGLPLVLVLALVVTLIAATVLAAASVVRRDAHARATWDVLRLGLRRATWPLRAPFLLRCISPGARLVLALFVGIAYAVAMLFLVELVGVLLLLALVPLAVLALGGGHRLIGWKAASDSEPDAWWSETVLLAALRTAGVLPRAKVDAAPVVLRRLGAPMHDSHGGTSVKLGLPPGVTGSSLAARREALAGALGVPLARLEIRSDPAESPNVVTLAVLAPRPSGSAASPLAAAAATRWEQPVRIGTDTRGAAVALATTEENVLVAGRPGAGKTTTARVVLAHYLLDATAEVFLLDGKGSARDYGAARPLCTRYVSGADEDAVQQTEALLDDVLGIVRARNAGSGEGLPPGGLLVLLEELQDVRAAADKATRERLDAVLGRIVRMGRAVGVTVLVSTQRPSVDDLPSGVRNLISQRLALMLRNGSDAALVLGHTPELPLPSKRGEALLTTAAGCTAVSLDHLTDDAWRAVCARAAALRPAATASPPAPASAPPAYTPGVPDVAAEPVEAEPVVPVSVRDPLVHAVVEVLSDSDPRGLPATALLGMLPGWLAPATPALLGRALGKAPEVERGHVGKAPVWRLAASLGEPWVHPRPTPRTEGTEGSGQGETPGQRDTEAAPSAPSVPSSRSAGGAA